MLDSTSASIQQWSQSDNGECLQIDELVSSLWTEKWKTFHKRNRTNVEASSHEIINPLLLEEKNFESLSGEKPVQGRESEWRERLEHWRQKWHWKEAQERAFDWWRRRQFKGAPSSIIFRRDQLSGSIGQNTLDPVWTLFLSKNHSLESYGSLKLHSSFTSRLFPRELLRADTNLRCRSHTFSKSYRVRPSTIF